MKKMPKKEKKKSWKERQRERQIKQQHVQEVYKIQSEKEAKKKPRKWPKGKIYVAICLIFLILGAYVVWQYTNTANPSDGTTPIPPTAGVIYIRPDGQINPSTAPISKVGDSYYKFTADINDQIIVEKDNITIDGANHLLQGAGEYYSKGIDLTERSNVTITNLEITGFDYGVYLSTASNNVLLHNNFKNNYCGIWIVAYSNDNIISGNNIESNEMYAIWLKESLNNKISENRITSHTNYSIYVRASNYTTFSANTIEDNMLGFFFYEASDNILYHNNIINNMNQGSTLTSTNVWSSDSSYGGNYWSDYEIRYPDAMESDGSGIWNTPYVIDDDNQDNYPLVNPWIID
jgi:parallel beta-helix repeat protein